MQTVHLPVTYICCYAQTPCSLSLTIRRTDLQTIYASRKISWRQKVDVTQLPYWVTHKYIYVPLLLQYFICNIDALCLLGGRKCAFWIFLRTLLSPMVRFSRLWAQIRSQVSTCEICSGQSDTGEGFRPSTSVFPLSV